MDALLANKTIKAHLLPFPDGSQVKILGWISLVPNQGNTKVALIELRKHYQKIVAFNVSGNSQLYWKHMKAFGFIDEIFDENGESYE